MLKPHFFISPAPVPEEIEFRVLGFARVAQYTLVKWRWGLRDVPSGDLTEGVYTDGESLWEHDTLLEHGWQGIVLYGKNPAIASQVPLDRPTVWERVDNRIGQFGIPAQVAIALRSPQNFVAFSKPSAG
jgi:hypothetical protein